VAPAIGTATLLAVDGLWRVLRFIGRSTRRLAILIGGLVVVVIGIALIPLPGPGWLVVFAGLAILATEFTWAEILLERAKRQATKAMKLAAQKLNGRNDGEPEQPANGQDRSQNEPADLS
jgi:hypothetical protein